MKSVDVAIVLAHLFRSTVPVFHTRLPYPLNQPINRYTNQTIMCQGLDHIPSIFGGMAEFAASNTGRQAEVADGDGVVFELICESISALCHGTYEDADALLGIQVFDVVAAFHNRRVEGQCYLAAVGRQVVRNGILNDFEQFLLRGRGTDREFVEELDHQTSEALEGTRNANCGRNFDEDAFGGVNVDLELAGFVDGRIEQGEEALVLALAFLCAQRSGHESSHLMRNIRSRVTNVAVHLPHDANVFIAIQQAVLLVLHAIAAAVGSLVCLEACI